jgi:hypothetical protein
MGTAEFQALMLLGGMAVQSVQLLAERRNDMTPEQQAEADALLTRIISAQNMVTPYEKEKG